MKIITGAYSGRNFYMPYGIRPTQNMLRKAVIDIIGHDLKGVCALELFSGSGAVGMEMLSCGASEVTFVEHNQKNAKTIEENLVMLRPGEHGQKVDVINQDAFATVKRFARENRKFHVVFFDPPYGLKLAKKTLKTLMTHDILHASSFVVAQYDVGERLPDPTEALSIIKDKTYGATRLTVFQKAA
ncbi:MAG: 16S rRNA (guanine(966)-N(2))-methyltransferase RsmD [Candidatus Omnitrophica bacterium]|nr:16S rRNA (guanine(966)-N(2))-methyltransferase RsmD [Candidatus Omnitrophota bacterium]